MNGKNIAIIIIAFCIAAVCHARELSIRTKSGYSPPMVGNGWLGAVMDTSGLKPGKVFVADGIRKGGRHGVSSIVPSVSPVNLQIFVDGRPFVAAQWEQKLQMDSAFVETRLSDKYISASIRYRVLRSMRNAMLANVEIRAKKACEVKIVNAIEGAKQSEVRRVWCREGGVGVMHGSNTVGDVEMEAAATFLNTDGFSHDADGEISIRLNKGERVGCAIVGVVCTSASYSDPWNEAERQAIYALGQGSENLIDRHNDMWKNLWQGRVTVAGDAWLQSVADACVYNLYSNIEDDGDRSVAPMGLTSDKYYGHVFWDADTWILPVLVKIRPSMAKSMLEFRYKGLETARVNARAHGYKGAMFPWEADGKGEESTPTFALTGPMEHHITADVANAAWLYYKETGDKEWLLRRGFPIIKDCADFWVSRADDNGDGSYSIRNVVGADEYAEGVDDNAFTNGAAKRALEAAVLAAEELGVKSEQEWKTVADGLRFHYDENGVVDEYEGYAGQMIKQADAVLLAYPLELITNPSDVKRLLDRYDKVLDLEHGPAMSHALMAVNYRRMGDEKRWREMLMRGLLPYLRGPFLNISETPSNNETYFLTGAGAVLQALMK